eukprot:TRINITY_DN75060_c0_g1_i1.p1 TRINITY_DN75060_c0_g1~~TRINITY_DN75060_c0_g1_i1.p1  ORF type:complete len:386 (-),score=84.28 TRINITY_DN75060_c0_g1_i1:45-1049(-)
MAGLSSHAMQVAGAIAFFVTSGPLLVIINKMILKDHGLHLPALVSAMGIIFTALFTHIMVLLGQVEVKKEVELVKLLPVGLSSAGTFMFGNMAYVYLDAGFIQMLKAGTPALLLFMLVAFKVERISFRVGLCVMFMVFGSVLAVAKAPAINWLGLTIMVLSEICEGGRCVLTQVYLQKQNFSVWDAGYWMAPVTAVSCLLLSVTMEVPGLLKSGEAGLFWREVPLLICSGVVGIAVNFASFLLIKLTSSLLTKLLVAARNAGLVLFFVSAGESYTNMEVLGYLITFLAFTAYSVVKVTEASQAKPKTEPTEDKESVEEWTPAKRAGRLGKLQHV